MAILTGLFWALAYIIPSNDKLMNLKKYDGQWVEKSVAVNLLFINLMNPMHSKFYSYEP
jgi:hypothetical protein